MKQINYSEVTPKQFPGDEQIQGVTMYLGISEADGAPNFAMRLFELEGGGHTPFHNHPWEHEVFIVAGQGELVLDDETWELKQGDFVYVDPGLNHQFKNGGPEKLQFICVIPHQLKILSH